MRDSKLQRKHVIGRPRGQERLGDGIVSLQRTRLLRSAVSLLAEHGYSSVSVAAICARAGVSRRTYYEIFENREECLAAILIDAEARVQDAIASVGLADAVWRERIHRGLWAILCLADSDPALARVCLVESDRAGEMVSAERERILSQLVSAIDEGRVEGTGAGMAGGLTAEALVGAVSAVLATRLAEGMGSGVNGAVPRYSLSELLGELTGMIVLPYLGPGAARRELERPAPQRPTVEPSKLDAATDGPDPLAGLSMRLTYRTARVLTAVSELGDARDGASNRQIAKHAGVADQGQISKLLSRLEHHGLLANAARESGARGEANCWTLTDTGKRLVHSIGGLQLEHSRRSAA
ncbi:MAG TPA: TetR/AcrR family transcriptional regulator [Solirubrobacteraceae bacterium]